MYMTRKNICSCQILLRKVAVILFDSERKSLQCRSQVVLERYMQVCAHVSSNRGGGIPVSCKVVGGTSIASKGWLG